MKYEEVVCVIPARGGSQSIKNKNLRLLNKQPLLCHSIRHALASGIPPHQVVVSSDSDEILEWGKSMGVEAHKRPDDISGPTSSSEEAVIYSIVLMNDLRDLELDKCAVVMLQPTSPIRLSKWGVCKAGYKDNLPLLRRCLEEYKSGDYDSLLTVTKFEDFFWTETEVSPGNYEWVPSYDPQNRPMRQQLGKNQVKYFDCGNIYITEADTLIETKCRVGKKPCVFPISHLEGLQIDTPEDLEDFRWIYERERR